MWRRSHRKRTLGPSDHALHEASQSVIRNKAREPEVKEAARALRLMRERNHFSEQLLGLMIGGGNIHEH